MTRTMLRDDQWERIKELLPGKASDCGVTAADNRLFLEAVLWVARTGAPWRDLPTDFGHWHRVYVRYNRWCHKDRLRNSKNENKSSHTLRRDAIAYRA